jgi:hypothetical protein
MVRVEVWGCESYTSEPTRATAYFCTHPAGVSVPRIGIKRRFETRSLHGIGLAKFHWLFVDGQNDTTAFADDTMPGARSIYGQSARSRRPVLITLGTREHQDVLVTGMFMQRDDAFGPIAKESGRWPGSSISVQSVDLHAIAERLPGNRARILRYLKEIRQLDTRISR